MDSISVKIIDPKDVAHYLDVIKPMVKKALGRDRKLYVWPDVVLELTSGLVKLILFERNGKLVACCGWTVIQLPRGKIARFPWFAAHEWDTIKDNIAERLEDFFRALDVDYIEVWARPGLSRYFKKLGFVPWEINLSKRLKA